MKLNVFFSIILTISFMLIFVAPDTQGDSGIFSLNSGSSYSRLCGERDLRGFWRVVKWIPYVEIKGADWRRPMFLRHQWMEFDGAGHLKTLASNKKMQLDDVRKRLAKAPWGVKIKFQRKGFCEISSEKERFPDSIWRCVVVTKNIKIPDEKYDILEGDVIMTLLGDEENILYFRLLRKVKPVLKEKEENSHQK